MAKESHYFIQTTHNFEFFTVLAVRALSTITKIISGDTTGGAPGVGVLLARRLVSLVEEELAL